MSITDLTDWLNNEETESNIWYIKRLSGNDTLANGANQAGPYIPREFIFSVFPSINQPAQENPDRRFELKIDSHDETINARVVWYNNRQRGGTRNETRITNLGGAASALLNPDSTGSLAIFSFNLNAAGEAETCHVWVCENTSQEEIVEDKVGAIEPGQALVWTIRPQAPVPIPPRTSCWLSDDEIPEAWLLQFPTGRELIRKCIELRQWAGMSIDEKLIARRKCEFELFKSIEHAFEFRNIANGFDSIDSFIKRAQTILQRRKSRSGKSLELHTMEIFTEAGLRENQDFQYQPESENGEKPDFLFPSETAYKNGDFPAEKLRMLGIKTTVKDRWAQVVKEANRVETKHLFTLQEGLSLNQFRNITEAKIKLVVPAPLISAYHEDIQPQLITLETFINEVKLLAR
jgi:hypothetical protein